MEMEIYRNKCVHTLRMQIEIIIITNCARGVLDLLYNVTRYRWIITDMSAQVNYNNNNNNNGGNIETC